MSFEKLLWNIAGAEESILEKCSTDHKKFSAIGATILMTAFIALCVAAKVLGMWHKEPLAERRFYGIDAD